MGSIVEGIFFQRIYIVLDVVFPFFEAFHLKSMLKIFFQLF